MYTPSHPSSLGWSANDNSPPLKSRGEAVSSTTVVTKEFQKMNAFSTDGPTSLKSAFPNPILGPWLGQVTENPMKVGRKPPPMIQSASILMKTPMGINNKGHTVWWEEIELCVVSKGRKPNPLPLSGRDLCVLAICQPEPGQKRVIINQVI